MPAGQVSEENPAGGSKVAKGFDGGLTVSTACPCRAGRDRPGRRRGRSRRWRSSASTRTSSAISRPSRPTPYRSANHTPATACRRARRCGSTSRAVQAGAGARRDGGAVRDAKSALPGQGFTVSRLTSSPTRLRASSRLRPARRISVAKGSKVTLPVSKGPATPADPRRVRAEPGRPDLVLQGAGFNVAVISTRSPTKPGRDRASTNPPAGADAKNGEIVRSTWGSCRRVARRRRHDHDDDAVSRRIAVILGGRSSETRSRRLRTNVSRRSRGAATRSSVSQIDRDGRWQLEQRNAGWPRRRSRAGATPGKNVAATLGRRRRRVPGLTGRAVRTGP